jgi:predicted DNA-binding transcriptional regulator YafY
VRVSPALASELPWHLGEDTREAIENAERDAHGWVMLELVFDSFEQARSRMLSFGGAVEVLEPEHLRLSVLDFAQQTIARYETGSPKEALP